MIERDEDGNVTVHAPVATAKAKAPAPTVERDLWNPLAFTFVAVVYASIITVAGSSLPRSDGGGEPSTRSARSS